MASHIATTTAGPRNFHLIITPSERDLLINALELFLQTANPERALTIDRQWWQDVFNDTHLPTAESLSDAIAKLQ